jgi:hypothetical protein
VQGECHPMYTQARSDTAAHVDIERSGQVLFQGLAILSVRIQPACHSQTHPHILVGKSDKMTDCIDNSPEDLRCGP